MNAIFNFFKCNPKRLLIAFAFFYLLISLALVIFVIYQSN